MVVVVKLGRELFCFLVVQFRGEVGYFCFSQVEFEGYFWFNSSFQMLCLFYFGLKGFYGFWI